MSLGCGGYRDKEVQVRNGEINGQSAVKLTLGGSTSRGVHGRSTGTDVLDLLKPTTSQDDVDNVPIKELDISIWVLNPCSWAKTHSSWCFLAFLPLCPLTSF
jgi:hypothetical protein